MSQYIKLNKKDRFKVISKYTNRVVTVVGLYIKDNIVYQYEIEDEGSWEVNRFNNIVDNVTKEEFKKLESDVEELKKILLLLLS